MILKPVMKEIEERLQSGTTLKFLLDQIEKAAIVRALSLCNNSRTKAAKYLGMGRTTLAEKIRKHWGPQGDPNGGNETSGH